MKNLQVVHTELSVWWRFLIYGGYTLFTKNPCYSEITNTSTGKMDTANLPQLNNSHLVHCTCNSQKVYPWELQYAYLHSHRFQVKNTLSITNCTAPQLTAFVQIDSLSPWIQTWIWVKRCMWHKYFHHTQWQKMLILNLPTSSYMHRTLPLIMLNCLLLYNTNFMYICKYSQYKMMIIHSYYLSLERPQLQVYHAQLHIMNIYIYMLIPWHEIMLEAA